MTAEKRKISVVEQAQGALKETLGRAVGNERLTAEGRSERTRADLRQAGHKAKDAFRR